MQLLPEVPNGPEVPVTFFLSLTVGYIISITNMLISVLYSFPFLINLMVSRRFQAFTPVLFL